MGASIFISYRRADAGGHAGRLFDRLSHWFDTGELFYDLDGVDIGDTFPDTIAAHLNTASVVLVVIGPDWVRTINERADTGQVDYVREEVARALARRASGEAVLIVPVLMGGATMPSPGALCDSLRNELEAIGNLNAHVFGGKHADWERQFVQLRERLVTQDGVPEPRFSSPRGTEQPYRVVAPSLSAHFQDPRGAVGALRRLLDEAHGVLVVARASLCGMGGVGKTQLALKYTLDYRDRYSGVWWFQAESESALALDAQVCCEAVGAPRREGEASVAAIKRWLDAESASWLLVFDNAEDPAVLRPMLPEAGSHHVVITSRNPAMASLGRSLEFSVWDEADGARFLATRLHMSPDNELAALTRTLGGLPLALEQAASYLLATGRSVQEYRNLIEDIIGGLAVFDEEASRAVTGYNRSVAATLSLAFERLSPAAAQLLRLCAYGAAEPLPERLFLDAADTLPNELFEVSTDRLAWNRTVDELHRYGLAGLTTIPAANLEFGADAPSTEQALTVHRLILQIARERLAVPEEDCRTMQAVLWAGLSRDTGVPAYWRRYASIVVHVVALDRFYESGWLHERMLAMMFDRVASYLRQAPALYADAARILQRVLEMDVVALGEEHPDTLKTMGNLATTYKDAGDIRASREIEERVLAGIVNTLGEAHPDAIISRTNLAITVRRVGDYEGALSHLEESLAICKRTHGEDHPDTLWVLSIQAQTLRELGDYGSARKLLEQVLIGRCRVFGELHRDTLHGMHDLAMVLEAQGQFDDACNLHGRVLECRRKLLGDDHLETISSKEALGLTLWRKGDLRGARSLFEHVWNIRQDKLGEDHPETLTGKSNMALVLTGLGRFSCAQTLNEQVLEARRRIFGENHPETLVSMNNLADTLSNRADYKAARALLEQFLAIGPGVFGENHPNVFVSMFSLANAYWHTGEHQAALEKGIVAVNGLREVLGKEHATTQLVYRKLAQWQEAPRE